MAQETPMTGASDGGVEPEGTSGAPAGQSGATPQEPADVISQSPREPSSPDSDGDGGLATSVPKSVQIAAWAYFALLIAVLAAIGLQGDLLLRLIRNEPIIMGVAIALTLFGGVLSAAILLWKAQAWAKWAVASGVLIAAGGLILGVMYGAISFDRRELPSLDLTVERLDENTISVSAVASVISLKTHEKMLMRVLMFGDPGPDKNPHELCNSYSTDRPAEHDEARVLFWGETGVGANGAGSTTWTGKVTIGEEVRHVCALTVNTARKGEKDNGISQWVIAITDVTPLAPATEPPATAPPVVPEPADPATVDEPGAEESVAPVQVPKGKPECAITSSLDSVQFGNAVSVHHPS